MIAPNSLIAPGGNVKKKTYTMLLLFVLSGCRCHFEMLRPIPRKASNALPFLGWKHVRAEGGSVRLGCGAADPHHTIVSGCLDGTCPLIAASGEAFASF